MRLTTVVIALAALTPALAQAQTHAASEASITSLVIEGCYVKNTGTIYRINVPNAPTKCTTNATAVSWNSQGPQGPTGPQGPVGPQGPAGSGLTGFELVYKDHHNIPQSTSVGVEVDCPVGKVVITGGFNVLTNATHQIMGSGPYVFTGEQLPRRWVIMVKTADGLGLTVFALCATASS
jgi:hypothetical protein